MRQSRLDMTGDRETGFTICSNGALRRGPEATGHRYGVRVDIQCPVGKPVGIFHTHPGGVPEPSDADITEAQRFNIPYLCIGVPETGIIRCHRVRRR